MIHNLYETEGKRLNLFVLMSITRREPHTRSNPKISLYYRLNVPLLKNEL